MLDVYKIRFFSVLLLFAVIAAYIQYIYTRTEENLPAGSILYQVATYKGKTAVTYAEVANILRNDPKLARKLKPEDKEAFDLASLHAYDENIDDTGHGYAYGRDDDEEGRQDFSEDGEHILFGVNKNNTGKEDGVVAKKADTQTGTAAPKHAHNHEGAARLNEPFLDAKSAAQILGELLKQPETPAQSNIADLPSPTKPEAQPEPLPQTVTLAVPKTAPEKPDDLPQQAITVPVPKPTPAPEMFDPQEVVLSVRDFDTSKPKIPPAFRKEDMEEEESDNENAKKKATSFFDRLSEKTASFFVDVEPAAENDEESLTETAETLKDENIFILPLSDAITDQDMRLPQGDNRRAMARQVAEIYEKKRKQTLAGRKLLKEKRELVVKIKSKLTNLGMPIEPRYASLTGEIYSPKERELLGLPDNSDLWRYPELTKIATELETLKQTIAFLPIYHPVTIKKSRMSSNYGYRRDPFTGRLRRHTGIDYAAPTGTRVGAGAPGIVTYAGWRGGYGNVVEVFHGKGLITRYAHLSKIIARRNTKVSVGTVVGLIGSTGRSTGPHLHYEVRLNGQPLNPGNFLQAGAAINKLLKE